ncbi:hypothetical protein FQJ96_00600 [Xanthomonas vasicola]|nr:hypothetical protein FQJ97_11525 [Xanthomonas vasicola]TWQ42091.1 hypothetical protein FQJ96_00600 [Xanthomonas vasicola]TWR03336.1 hypothetical protein FQJ87_12440 [Xanthomonas vasicola]
MHFVTSGTRHRAPPAPLRGPRQGAGDRGFMDTNTLALLGASALTVIVGLARLVAWILDRRAEAALRAHREQVFIIESYADLVASSLAVDYVDPCVAAAEERAELMADATSGYWYGRSVA